MRDSKPFNETDILGFNGIKLKGKCANLESRPQNINNGSLSGHVVTIPDMHGNAIKLIYYLISLGIIKDLNETTYDLLSGLYNRSNRAAPKDSTQWIHLIKSLEFDPKAVGRLILIGDTLADRGNNDLYTECVLHALMTKVPNVTLIMSNHDAHNFTGGKSHINQAQALSYIYGKRSIEQHKTQHNRYIKTILSKLKLLDYELCGDDKIIIYSHAMIPNVDETIEVLAQELGVKYHGNTAIQLAATIEKINTGFIKQYFRKDSNGIPYMKYEHGDESQAIWRFFWLKTTDYLESGNEYVLNDNVQIVHGHDSNAKYGVVNLDKHNELGKSPEDTTGNLIYSTNSSQTKSSVFAKILKEGEENYITRNYIRRIANQVSNSPSEIITFCQEANGTTESIADLLKGEKIFLFNAVSYILQDNDSETKQVADSINKECHEINANIKATSEIINDEITDANIINTGNEPRIANLYENLDQKIQVAILKEAYGSRLINKLRRLTYQKILALSSAEKITNYINDEFPKGNISIKAASEIINDKIINTENEYRITNLYKELDSKIQVAILKEAYGSSLTHKFLSATYLKILASSSVTKITNYLQEQAKKNSTGNSKSGEVLSRFSLFTNANGDSQAAHTTPQKTPNNNA